MKRKCAKCQGQHEIYYLIKSNNETSMFMLCPEMKGRDQIFVLFISKEEGLSIPTYSSGTKEYDSLKNSLEPEKNRILENSPFSKGEQEYIINQWRKAKLTLSNMTKDQMLVVREYVKGDIKW